MEEDLIYENLEGGSINLDTLQKAIDLRKFEIERAEFIEELVRNGNMAKYFSTSSRRYLIGLAVSHLSMPGRREEVENELMFHSKLEPFLFSLIHSKQIHIEELKALEQKQRELMGSYTPVGE